ncbi:MAG: hypothetical protein NTV82_00355 [Candidatus Aminicenantes bacterium]|nr:hypothetical protein [Candidatus Aminicenantes bacterium]
MTKEKEKRDREKKEKARMINRSLIGYQVEFKIAEGGLGRRRKA